jgi:hypothetical protein
MPELFSADWMNELKDHWNDDPEVKNKLAEIGFNSIITCGIKGDDKPLGVFVVEDGECIRAGAYNGEEPDWDMRADRKNWMKWVKKPFGMMGMGMAYGSRKLVFVKGDYGTMMKTPSMAGPFVKSFSLMGKISTQ